MFKHSQTVRRQFSDELFECVWPFCEIGAERVKVFIKSFTKQRIYRANGTIMVNGKPLNVS